jgi:hypothetical protein
MTQQSQSPASLFESQKQRLSVLSERRTRMEVARENNQKLLAEARAEAEKLFGTSDLEQLRTLFREGEASNVQAVMDFMMSLDSVEEQLASIDRQANAV